MNTLLLLNCCWPYLSIVRLTQGTYTCRCYITWPMFHSRNRSTACRCIPIFIRGIPVPDHNTKCYAIPHYKVLLGPGGPCVPFLSANLYGLPQVCWTPMCPIVYHLLCCKLEAHHPSGGLFSNGDQLNRHRFQSRDYKSTEWKFSM